MTIHATRHTLPYKIAHWSLDEPIVYLIVDGRTVPWPVTYFDADETDCQITIDGIDYRFQI